MEIMHLFMTPDEKLYDKKITDFFDDEVLNSNFWMYWRTMFAFENWHSALEMKRYLQRYIHHIGGLPDFTALRFTRYNQYESMILPMVKYLEGFGVQFHYDTKVDEHRLRLRRRQKAGHPHRHPARWPGRLHRPDRERPRLYHERRLCRELDHRQPEHPRRVQARAEGGRRLGPVAQDRRAGPELRPSRQVLL